MQHNPISRGLSAAAVGGAIMAMVLAGCGNSQQQGSQSPAGAGSPSPSSRVSSPTPAGYSSSQLAGSIKGLSGYTVTFSGHGTPNGEQLQLQSDAQGNLSGSITIIGLRGSYSGKYIYSGGNLYLQGSTYLASFTPTAIGASDSTWYAFSPTDKSVLDAIANPQKLAGCISQAVGSAKVTANADGSYTAKTSDGGSITAQVGANGITSLTWVTTAKTAQDGCPGTDALVPLESPLVGTITITPAVVAPIAAPPSPQQLNGD